MRLRALWPEWSILMELMKKCWCGVDSIPPTRVMMGVTDRDTIGAAVGCGAGEIHRRVSKGGRGYSDLVRWHQHTFQTFFELPLQPLHTLHSTDRPKRC